ncbi:chromatin modification-related protein EAF1 B-like isoform X2 [Lolium rigidum]|uniref:chromatin modification-related protein EAF1 B-like isoform X2 n=1 Tax=Lolium rigidum TaxID=89674 RepID=UPI001F5C358E|nr:chromatin modification-related protein EAF1 B-like isoform X2 [Lolium rigidum]
MGGMVEYGVSVSTRSSPRSAAIEKAQEELRQEYDVREERRRELEFLEKGGNPLDFRFDHVESVSLQSTSLTDPIVEQNVISEAKGSFTFAASPHGDSVESSGQPGSSLCRETNTADNLMLFGGDNNGAVKEKVVKRGSRRTNVAQLRQTSDGHNNAKRSEDSGLSRLGAKSQAYVRRNRSKSCRESTNVTSVTSPVIAATVSEPKDSEGVIKEKQADDLGASHGSSLNQAEPKYENGPNTASDEHMITEFNGIQPVRESHCIAKFEAMQGDYDSKATETVPNDVNGNQQADKCGEIAEEGASLETPDGTSKTVLRSSYSSASTHDEIKTCAADEKFESDQLDGNLAHIHVGRQDNDRPILVCALKAATSPKNVMDPRCEETASTIDNHADGNKPVPMIIDRKSHEDLDISGISSKTVKEGGQVEVFSRPTSVIEDSSSIPPEVSTIIQVKDEMEICDDAIGAEKDASCSYPRSIINNKGSPGLERIDSCHGDSNSAHPIGVGSALNTLPESAPSLKTDASNVESEIQKCGENVNQMTNKEYEDSILRKARLIEVGLKRACERSPCNISLERRRKGHWDFVLEEMAWMANDFKQERLWRITAASQVCHWIASDGLAKFDQASILRKQKTVIRCLAKGIMSFWRSAEAVLTTGGRSKVMQKCDSDMPGETKPTGIEAEKEQGNESMETEQSTCPLRSQIQDYAVRFLEYNNQVSDSVVLTEAPPTPDRLNDFGILKVSDQLSQGSLFYTVPPGAMLAYRESMESLFMYHKRIGNTELKYDYEASACDSAADWAQENMYDEDEGDASTYLLSEAHDGGLLSKMAHKKKHIMHQRINSSRPYETDVSYEPCLESKSGNNQFYSNGKRPSSFVGIPTKRVRTAARQRVVSPFAASVGGTPRATSKTDVSSGDTDSYQDDQSSLHGGWKNMDYESTVDFDRKLPYDGSEEWTKASKKKKHKNTGYKTAQNTTNSRGAAVKGRIYDQRSQVNMTTQYEQDYLKKRSETHQFYSNGTIVANGGQHASKKLKMMKQGMDMSQEASHVASHMSNMGNPGKVIKIITNNKDRGRKVKALKMSSGGGWSNFEDQALVVLVHDLGQNWELVSDAINHIVQFKTVHRQPKECKDRHKVLVDKSSGDGADSAEDSGSSQHYHFTIPGIPQGSARQLFQRLQGPFEEENLKSHFEKIILLMPQVQYRRRQVNSRELKPIVQPHSSHIVALSQASPNNISGGILTPLDLCDATTLNLDAVTPGSGYQGSHANGMTLSNQHVSAGPTTSTPIPNLNPRLPGSPGMVLGSNMSPPSTLSAPSRDSPKYGVPRPASLQGDEQQKVQYTQMPSGRNLQQPGGSVPGTCPAGVDRGPRMISGAHGVGMTTGVHRGIPAARAGFPRASSPGMLNMVSTGNMPLKSVQGVPNAVNVHAGAMSAPGNSILRPRDPMQMIHPGQHMEEHRRVVKPELHLQVSPGSSQAAHFSSMNPSFSKSAASSPLQQTQRPHLMSQPPNMMGNPHLPQTQGASHSSPHQQPYAMQLAKDRQYQHRMVSQQHNDLSVASVVPSVQKGPQTKQQNLASAVASTAASQPPHPKQQSAKNPPGNSALHNQPANATEPKQKKLPGQQQPRQNQQQRNQASQQAKLMKSLGRGNMQAAQTPTVDATPAGAVSTASKKQASGNKASISVTPQPGNQHKLYPSVPQSAKQFPDIGNQGLMQAPPSHTVLASQPPPLHAKFSATMQQQNQRQANPSQNSIQRLMVQQNAQMKPDCRVEAQIDQAQRTQVIPALPISHGMESGSPGSVPSVNQQKPQASVHDPAAVTSTPEPFISPKGNSVGNETPLPSSSQGMLQRQLSGGLSMHGSPKSNFAGNETPLPPSSQGILQRQLSGGLPMHGQDVGGLSWHQQHFRPPHVLHPPHQQQAQHQQEASALVDPAAVMSTSEPPISPKVNFVGNETPSPSSSQGMLERQLSGGLPMHGQDVVGGSWHQQQFRQPPQHQQQRPVAPGSLYAPSNSGSS